MKYLQPILDIEIYSIESAEKALSIEKPKLINDDYWNKFSEQLELQIILWVFERVNNSTEKANINNYSSLFVNSSLETNIQKIINDKNKYIDIIESQDNLIKEEIQLSIEKEEVFRQKDKIEKQLVFINELLENPNRINRVEDYDNTFSKGNLDNLKKVAEYLRPNEE